jgi:hypothetical protein
MAGNEGFESLSPVALVEPVAEQIIHNKYFDNMGFSPHERSLSAKCNQALRLFGMIRRYGVEAGLAFVLDEDPVPDYDGQVTVHRLDRETSFRGRLLGQRILKIGDLAGQPIRAVGLAFEEVFVETVTPAPRAKVILAREIEKDERMFVPAFAFHRIEPVS